MVKILIIEDEERVSRALTSKLRREGFEVDIASDGEKGLTMALETKPKLILLDIILPKMDGLTMVKKLREDEWGANVPVIILTNLDSAEKAIESKKTGVDDYLVKTDWSLSDLVEKIKGVVNK